MPIPEHYQRFCNNPELEIYSCDYLTHLACPSTCMLARKLSQGISHTAKTGLERFMERYGEDYLLIAIGEQCSVPSEIRGEYRR